MISAGDLSWTLDEKDSMILVIKYKGLPAMRIFLGEAIESAGRKAVMKHVKECDRSPWLSSWQNDLMDLEYEILTGK